MREEQITAAYARGDEGGNASGAVTEVARVELSCGALNALRALRYTNRFPPHFHDTFAVGVVETGATLIRTQRGEWLARAGSILAFAPNQIHSAIPATEQGYSYRMVYPTEEFIRGVVTARSGILDSGRPPFHTPVIEDPDLGRDFLASHGPLMAADRSPAAEQLLIQSLRAMFVRHRGDEADSVILKASDRLIVNRAQLYLQDRFAQRVRLAALASECRMSPFHLIRIFRRVIGVTPYAYLVQLRVNRAQEMLSRGNSISEVAYSCGFSDQAHLTRTFKKAVGVPPGQYVRQVASSAA